VCLYVLLRIHTIPSADPARVCVHLQGLVDGHFQPTCRPGGDGCINANVFDQDMYNGKEKQHGLKFQVRSLSACAHERRVACNTARRVLLQAIAFPNGICVLHGPFLGPEHDSTMMTLSDIEDELRILTTLLNLADPLALYGDCAYAESDHLVRAFPHALADASKRRLNAVMSKIRVVVEQLFACIDQTCPLLVKKHALKMGQGPIGMLFPVACLLHNCKTLLYGNTVASSVPGGLDMLADAMTLEEYMQ
jgi:hypothetical protein